MGYTIQQIAEALGMEMAGNAALRVDAAREPKDAQPDDLALAMKADYAEDLQNGAARAAMLWDGADWRQLGLEAAIFVPRPRFALAGLTRMFDAGQGWAPGIHRSAVVDDSAELGADVSVGPLAVIGPGARIGDGSTIGPQAYIGTDVVIGRDALVREGARICARVVIGDRFIAQPNAVVGGDGFSYVTPEVSGAERVRETLGDQGEIKSQVYDRIHSLGAVRLGDDVEVGSLSAVDRGTIRDTVVGNGSKIDNLVQVGHNCVIGDNSLLCGLVGLAGSVTVGNNVILAGQTGVADNVFIGDNVITGGATTVLSNIPAGRVMLGYPAMKMETAMDVFKGLRRLKRLFADVDRLKSSAGPSAGSDAKATD
ncbi:MAG: UDP-3-O-(3-hydroxymyristoyl)glucosamine N-acyltransferase [Pseudomonadota bacterium]